MRFALAIAALLTALPAWAGDVVASCYGPESGPQTASGERFDWRAMTAAHRTLPFGTPVKVTNLSNGRSIAVRINDRGPFVKGRIIDLTPAAAAAIGCPGLCQVTIEPIIGYVPQHGDWGAF